MDFAKVWNINGFKFETGSGDNVQEASNVLQTKLKQWHPKAKALTFLHKASRLEGVNK